MPKFDTTGNLALAGFDDIFSTGANNADGEVIVLMPLADLFPPELHPFQVNDDDAMYRLAESIRNVGVREPGLVRPRPEGGFELLCGNRRKRASELAGKTTMPVILRNLNDSEAADAILGNLEHREKILPSERAWAYKVMMDDLNHNGVKGESHSYEIMVERTGIKRSQLFRFIRLTELIADLIDKVDLNQLAFNPGVELSYLSVQHQTAVVQAMAAYQVKPSLSQAVRLKQMSQSGELTVEAIHSVIEETKKPPKGEPTGSAKYRRFFPPSYSPKQIDKVIVELLKDWKASIAE